MPLLSLADIGPHEKIFADGQLLEHLAAFGNQGDAHAHNFVGVHTVDALAHELDGALVRLVFDEPMTVFKIVDLPAPLLPRMAVMLPSSTVREAPRMA
jgi:hypothetical protein